MLTAADLPRTIPVFPLPEALLLPRARLPLHIFEPRYLAMLEDVLKTEHRLVGMARPQGEQSRQRLHSIGCAGRVTAFSEIGDGRQMITLTGISRFTIARQVEVFTPYIRVDADWSGFESDLGQMEADPGLDRATLLNRLGPYFDARQITTDWNSLKQAKDEILINSLSMLCPFEPEEKQALLEAPTLAVRRETLMALLDFALRGGAGKEALQ